MCRAIRRQPLPAGTRPRLGRPQGRSAGAGRPGSRGDRCACGATGRPSRHWAGRTSPPRSSGVRYRDGRPRGSEAASATARRRLPMGRFSFRSGSGFEGFGKRQSPHPVVRRAAKCNNRRSRRSAPLPVCLHRSIPMGLRNKIPSALARTTAEPRAHQSERGRGGSQLPLSSLSPPPVSLFSLASAVVGRPARSMARPAGAPIR